MTSKVRVLLPPPTFSIGYLFAVPLCEEELRRGNTKGNEFRLELLDESHLCGRQRLRIFGDAIEIEVVDESAR
jgi:hypothetical protein